MFGSKIVYRVHFRRVGRGLRLAATGLLLLVSISSIAQHKFWYFFDTNVPRQSARETLQAGGLQPVVWSEWFHAWSATGSPVEAMPGVDSSRYVAPLRLASAAAQDPLMGFALEQIGASALVNQRLTGKGVKIGIIDGGFLSADKSGALPGPASGRQPKAFRNFVSPASTNPFAGSLALDDAHGTEVWELIGGYNATKRIQFGLATGADFYLAVTDHGAREERQEEDFLIAALEWLDSLEVKLVNVSLGYNTGYDDPSENYVKEMMDGKTALASLACQKATDEKGMLIVVAAGNGGQGDWRFVNVPADAEGVLTVGATDLKFWRKMPTSSVGPDFTAFLKPDISCFSSTGTSFSAPVITGLAACLWELEPTLSNKQLKNLILQSGHLVHAPNNYLGHGVPDASWAMEVAKQQQLPAAPRVSTTQISRKKKRIALEGQGPWQVVLYHKTDSVHVANESFFTHTAPFLDLERPDSLQLTTVIVDRQWVMEIEWRR